jgi:hypothetical protein
MWGKLRDTRRNTSASGIFNERGKGKEKERRKEGRKLEDMDILGHR